jgi:peptidoglycan hydrolase CwlO-like protein
MMGALFNNNELAEIIETNRLNNRRLHDNLNNATNEIKMLQDTILKTQIELDSFQKSYKDAKTELLICHTVVLILSLATLMMLCYAVAL